jgi:hypothetical protein
VTASRVDGPTPNSFERTLGCGETDALYAFVVD